MNNLSKTEVTATVAELDEQEQQLLIRKAVSQVHRELGCSPAQAVAYICRDWMELRGLELLSPNPLANSTPADFKPTWLDRVKQFL